MPVMPHGPNQIRLFIGGDVGELSGYREEIRKLEQVQLDQERARFDAERRERIVIFSGREATAAGLAQPQQAESSTD